MACFDPHHAFVFLDDDQSVVGHIDICFLCNQYRASPLGYAVNWDLNAVAELFVELELEISNPNW